MPEAQAEHTTSTGQTARVPIDKAGTRLTDQLKQRFAQAG
jgi:hypothetical protein